MRSATLFIACLSILFSLTLCRQKENQHEIYMEADSLVALTMVLQSRIGSPEIQRMHEFQEEIDKDLSSLSAVPIKDTSLLKYQELYNRLGQCLQACNQYHEEAYLLESSLREIMVRIQSKEAELVNLHELLHLENDNYAKLSRRIDSSMDLAILHAEVFYSLKPGIDKMRGQIDLVPDPTP
ncbi:hypothetical protein ACFLR8_03240 [Bacteroidota bacterium]